MDVIAFPGDVGVHIRSSTAELANVTASTLQRMMRSLSPQGAGSRVGQEVTAWKRALEQLLAVREQALEFPLTAREQALEQAFELTLEQGLEQAFEQALEQGLEQALEKGLEQELAAREQEPFPSLE